MSIPTGRTRRGRPRLARQAPPRLTDPDELKFGSRLRARREALGMTLEEVAQATRLTKGYLSQIERDLTSPSLSALWRICAHLGITVGSLTDPDAVEQPPVYVERRPLRGDPDENNEHFSLSDYEDPRFHASESYIAPGGTFGAEPYSIPGELEFVYIVSGQLEFHISNSVYTFNAGDAFTYWISEPHRWRNPSKTQKTHVVWVAIPNPYAPKRYGPGARPPRHKPAAEH
jgi:transcriptional regulator with XRE-family HTH domain